MAVVYKKCGKCRENLQAGNFSKSRTRPDGLQPVCRDCQSIYARVRKYGISADWLMEYLHEIDYSCEICGISFHERRSEIDHDHAHHTVRGILCKRCNLLIGYAGDDIEVLKKAIAYLQERGPQ